MPRRDTWSNVREMFGKHGDRAVRAAKRRGLLTLEVEARRVGRLVFHRAANVLAPHRYTGRMGFKAGRPVVVKAKTFPLLLWRLVQKLEAN